MATQAPSQQEQTPATPARWTPESRPQLTRLEGDIKPDEWVHSTEVKSVCRDINWSPGVYFTGHCKACDGRFCYPMRTVGDEEKARMREEGICRRCRYNLAQARGRMTANQHDWQLVFRCRKCCHLFAVPYKGDGPKDIANVQATRSNCCNECFEAAVAADEAASGSKRKRDEGASQGSSGTQPEGGAGEPLRCLL